MCNPLRNPWSASSWVPHRIGKRCNTPEKRKSHSDAMALLNESDAATATGASGDVAGIRDEEPMCMHTTVFVSAQARNSGSQ